MSENKIKLRLELNCGLEDYRTKYCNLNRAIEGQQCVVEWAKKEHIDGYQETTSD